MAKHLLGIKKMQREDSSTWVDSHITVISLEPPNEDLGKASHRLGLLFVGLSYLLLCSCLFC